LNGFLLEAGRNLNMPLSFTTFPVSGVTRGIVACAKKYELPTSTAMASTTATMPGALALTAQHGHGRVTMAGMLSSPGTLLKTRRASTE